ncbi:FAD-dependent oxidoreductase [Ornithinimicrobium sp. Arc0846-15]|nr:FAD-dependent oxidoreductase [Ornithinimicrobium laminariae]
MSPAQLDGPTPQRLVLVGAGHTHLHLLRHADALRAAGYWITLVAPTSFRYSGVAVSTSTGALPENYGLIDVSALARGNSVDHIADRMVDVDRDARIVTTAKRERIPYDVLSLNLGSQASSEGIDVAQEVTRIKPLDELAQLNDRLDGARQITIIGGGPTALELAGNLSTSTGRTVRVVEAGPRLASGLPPKASAAIAKLLAKRGVEIILNAPVTTIKDSMLTTSDGTVYSHDLAVLATGLTAAPAPAGLGGPRGIPVRGTLQHRDDDDIYACGDVADFLLGPLPKLGVYGVRQGPVLLRNLVARAAGEPHEPFKPQRSALQVIDLGATLGLAVRGRWWWLGRAPLHLKRRIDARWLARVRE